MNRHEALAELRAMAYAQHGESCSSDGDQDHDCHEQVTNSVAEIVAGLAEVLEKGNTAVPQPWKDTYMAVLALRTQLAEYWSAGQLTAPEGGDDINAIMSEVDRHLLAAELLLRPEEGNVQTAVFEAKR